MKIENPVLYSIWEDRYKKNNESLDDNLKRVAKYCSYNEEEEKSFYEMMDKGLFFPAGRTMSNAGIGMDLTLNNCFVAPQIKDNLDDIFSKVALGAKTHQRGGGIGYDFSQLRPNGSPTSNDAIASGSVSFMDVFNAQTSTILQGNRRGANMGVMNIYSMDIEEFITSKSKDANKLNHFNISVMVDDDFMIAKNNNQDIELHFPVYDENGNILKDESKWKYKKSINAKYLWDLIIQNAYNTGEPGVFYYNNMNNDNNLWYIEKIVCSNPCAEYLAGTIYGKNPQTGKILNANDFGGACNLGSLMLHNFVDNAFKENAVINYALLEKSIGHAVRFLDNIIDINKYPDEIYKNYQTNFRTIGLGITGLANMLVMLNIKYGSIESLEFIDKLMNFITKNIYKASINLAKEKGSFNFLDKDKFIQSQFITKHIKIDPEWNEILEDIKIYGIRNSKMISVAPTGTMSLTYGGNCSSGLEPIFSLSYERKVKIGSQSDEDIQIVKMEDYSYKLWQEVKDGNIVEKNKFATAMDLTVKEHLEMLKTINFHVDMSSSKTINIPINYSFEDTKLVYDYCWENGVKGCTIFRPNEIRQGILMTDVKKEDKDEEKIVEKTSYSLQRGDILLTDDGLIGRKRKLTTGCGSLHMTAFFEASTGEFLELFLSKGSSGGCNNTLTGLSRMVSLAARGGIDIHSIIDQLKSSGTCPSYAVRKALKNDTSIGSSCPIAVGMALLEMHKEIQEEIDDEEFIEEVKFVSIKEPSNVKEEIFSQEQLEKIKKYGEISFAKEYNICPRCATKLNHVEGCISCLSGCGWSKCD